MVRLALAAVASLAMVAFPTMAFADSGSDADAAAITQRLQDWTAAFNDRDSNGVCDLFAPDLISSAPGAVDDDRKAVCGRLAAVFAKRGLQLHYDAPDIREIIVNKDIAIVRLFWTLTTRKDRKRSVNTEAGMDIFKRQQDGRWAIMRMLSFSTERNRLLE